MRHTKRSFDIHQTAKPQKKRAKRKQQILCRLLILVIITFTFGFLLGLWVGSPKEHTLNFVLSSDFDEKEAAEKLHLPWNLTLVNYHYSLDKNFVPENLAEINNGYEADSRIADSAKNMIADAASENVQIIALSAYRPYEYQRQLYDNKVQSLQQENDYSVDKAQKEAATVVAYPGTSEHQLGLALDLVDAKHTELDESQEHTPAYQWLKEHCHEYGFIVRYPNGKTDITGIIYEPWHFRYVGKEAAAIIMEQQITLEEYIETYY